MRAEDQDLAVADAKYKDLKPDEWPNADLYQMLAYCVALGLPSGLLIYASDRPYEEHLVERAGVRLGIVGVDMNGGTRDLDASVRRAATHFVQEAVARRFRPTIAV